MDRRQNQHWVWCLVGVIGLFGAPTAMAQLADIPIEVREKNAPLGADETALVQKFVQENSKNLLSTDPVLLRKDRNAILKKLEGTVSVPFRLEYSKALVGPLQGMFASKTDLTVINGLVIAGEVATDTTLAMVQSRNKDGFAPIRFAAASALGRVFLAAQLNQPAVNQLSGAVKGLEPLIAAEKDPHVQEALIRTALVAAQLPQERSNAISAMSKGVSGLLRPISGVPMDAAHVAALQRASVGLRDIAVGAGQVTPAAAKDAAEASGRILVTIAKMVEKTAKPGELANREVLVQLSQSTQTTIELVGQLLNGKGVELGVGKLGDTLGKKTRNDDASYVVDVGNVVTALSKVPFEVPAERLK